MTREVAPPPSGDSNPRPALFSAYQLRRSISKNTGLVHMFSTFHLLLTGVGAIPSHESGQFKCRCGGHTEDQEGGPHFGLRRNPEK